MKNKKPQTKLWFGASSRIRTGDLLITNQLLYRLSHTSSFKPYDNKTFRCVSQ